ncbi:MAG: hypothetical protein JKX88_02350 [Marinicaulis sp.]|nr:hypothetical protein [Marinicaulis sp.]
MNTLLRENPVRLKERRLARRVEKVWLNCAQDHLPTWADIQKTDLGDDWNFCFAVDMRLSDGFPYFIYLGDDLCRFSNIYLSGRHHCEMTLLDLATSKMDEAALSRAPVFFNDALRIYNRRRIVFRSVLLPLSENGTDVTHVFGAANGKGI